MAAISGFIGVLAVVLGLNGSLTWDTPAGPSIVVAALGCFVISILPFKILRVSIFKQTTK
jgi:zinc transport system permease protein